MAAEPFNRDLSPGELLIVLDGQRPFSAADIASLLSSLSNDYRAANPGRQLLVTSLQTGSLWVTVMDGLTAAAPYVKDAAVLAKDGKAIFDFGKAIRDELVRKKKQSVPLPQPIAAHLPHRSVEKIAQITADSGRGLYLHQKGADGSELQLEMKPPELEHIHHITQAERRLRRSPREKVVAMRMPLHDVSSVIDQLASIDLSDAETLIRTMTTLLEPQERARYLARLAGLLREEGHTPLADLVIRELDRIGRRGR